MIHVNNKINILLTYYEASVKASLYYINVNEHEMTSLVYNPSIPSVSFNALDCSPREYHLHQYSLYCDLRLRSKSSQVKGQVVSIKAQLVGQESTF